MKRCHRCHTEWESTTQRPGFKETCEKCGVYLHCCLNCGFYDPTKHNQCAVGTTEFVADKEKFNLCDDFRFADATEQAVDDAGRKSARESLDALFGESETESPGVDEFNKWFKDP